MEPAETIRIAVEQVARLRQDAATHPPLGEAISWVKQFQSKRFAATYADLIAGDQYRAATRFFLEKLYSDASFEERDTQFSRVAGALQRFLPQPALSTAVGLAQLHALSEQLDHAMGHALMTRRRAAESDDASRYIHAWRSVGRRTDREAQLQAVLKIGADLDRLTRTPGLRLLLKMMRGPAYAGGLGALQCFLESGFDTFAAMGKRPPGASGFISIVRARESEVINLLFKAELRTFQYEILRASDAGPL